MISLSTFGQTKSDTNLILVSEVSYKYSHQKPTPPRIISHKLPIINLIGIGVSKEIQDTFWLFNDSDDTLLITNIESLYLAYFQITNKLLPKQKTPLVFKARLQNNEYDFTTNPYYATVTLSNNAKLFFNIIIPTISNNMVAVYKDDGVTMNYAISKIKDHRYSLVVFMNERGGLLAKGLIRDGDTTQKVGYWYWAKDGYETLKIVQYSKSLSLSAFDNNIQNPHTNFSIKVLENRIWQEPIVDIIDNEKRIFITSKTDGIVAYTDSSRFRFKLNYKKLNPHTSKQFFLLKPNETTLPINRLDVPYSLLTDCFAIVFNDEKNRKNGIRNSKTYDLILDNYLQKYPKIIKLFDYNSINLKALSAKEKQQLLREIESDSLIKSANNLCSFPFSKHFAYCDNVIYIDVDENKLNKCKRAIHRLGFSFSKKENKEIDYWHIEYKKKIVDKGFFDGYCKIAKMHFVNKISLNIIADKETTNQLNKL